MSPFLLDIPCTKTKNLKELSLRFQIRNPGQIFDPPGAHRHRRLTLVDLGKKPKKTEEGPAWGPRPGFISKRSNGRTFHDFSLILS